MDDRAAVQELIAAFFLAFDDADWPRLRDCLAGRVQVDYADLRGDPPDNIAAEEYVAAREESLEGLRTLHVAGTPRVTLSGERAAVACSALILRTADDGATFDTAARYDFAAQRRTDGWRIDAIRQRVLWNRGDPRVHGALRH